VTGQEWELGIYWRRRRNKIPDLQVNNGSGNSNATTKGRAERGDSRPAQKPENRQFMIFI
jgi:hypothetical protein